MTPTDKRKNARRALNYPALIDAGDGSSPRKCLLFDVSQDGAQLQLAEPSSLPDSFVLALSADGAARRRCRVVWRRDQQVGVEFLKEPKLPNQWARFVPDTSARTSDTQVSEATDASDLALPPR